MIQKNYALNHRQIGLISIAFLITTKFFSMPSSASKIANEDMWLSVLICLILDFVVVAFLVKANAKHKADFYSILSSNFSPTVAKIIYLCYFIFFLSKGFTPLFEEYNFLQITLYEANQGAFIFLPFLIIAVYLSVKPIRCLGRLADALFIITVLSTLLLLYLSTNEVDFTSILPIGATKSKILRGSYYINNWFNDGAYFLFFLGNFKPDEKNSKIYLLTALKSLFIVIFCVLFYAVFSTISSRELYAIAEISKYSNVINSIGRFDYIAIFMLLLPHTIAVSLPIFFATKILIKVFNVPKKLRLIPALITALLLYAPIVWLKSYSILVITFIHTYLTPFCFLLGTIFPIALYFLRAKTHPRIHLNVPSLPLTNYAKTTCNQEKRNIKNG